MPFFRGSYCAILCNAIRYYSFIAGFLLLQENVVVGVVPDHFDKYYTFAVGIYSCGTGLGMMILPILTQFFLDTYGWRGAILLLSGLACHSVPCGALLKSIKNTDEANKRLMKHTEQHSEENKDINECDLYKDIGKAFGLQLLTKASFVSEVLVPGFVWGYTITGWMIYMVSFAVSKGLSVREGSIVATSGGIGVIAVRIAIPLLHKVMTYKQIMYGSSVLIAVSLILTSVIEDNVTLNVISVMYGLGNGALGGELYISAKVNSKDSEFFYAVSWLHMAYGLASILTGFVTGTFHEMSAI